MAESELVIVGQPLWMLKTEFPMKPPHLLVCISGHGYGHVAQTAPVLDALLQLVPDLQITLRTSVPLAHLRSRIHAEFHYLQEAVDPGMEMVSALEVDAERSFQAYADFHHDWDARVAAEEKLLSEIAPDVVLTNVAYLPLAAAARLNIPAVAMCSLNWADIFGAFCGQMPRAEVILAQQQQAYLQADAFLRLSPAMPMMWMPHVQEMGPVAQPRTNRRSYINQKLGLKAQHKLVLVSMGGIAMQLPVESWPTLPNVLWVIPDGWQTGREDCLPLGSLGVDFSDVLASCDVLLTKPGYGSFVEAACAGVPVLYVKREAWPEQEVLIAWLEQHGVCAELGPTQLQTGEFREKLLQLLQQEKSAPIAPAGTLAVAQYVGGLLAASLPVRSAWRHRN